jgi:cytochrome c
MRTVVAALACLALLLPTVDASAMTAQERRGRDLASRMCASCHVIGRRGDSPHIGAPRFRQLDRRVDLDNLGERLRAGLISGHPDMPTFSFSREDADAFVAYLRAIAGP